MLQSLASIDYPRVQPYGLLLSIMSQRCSRTSNFSTVWACEARGGTIGPFTPFHCRKRFKKNVPIHTEYEGGNTREGNTWCISKIAYMVYLSSNKYMYLCIRKLCHEFIQRRALRMMKWWRGSPKQRRENYWWFCSFVAMIFQAIFGRFLWRKRVLETGVWLKLWQTPARLSQPFPLLLLFLPFFLPLFSFLSHSG